MVLQKILVMKNVDGQDGRSIKIQTHKKRVQVWWLDDDVSSDTWWSLLTFSISKEIPTTLKDFSEDVRPPKWAWEFVRQFSVKTLVYLAESFGEDRK